MIKNLLRSRDGKHAHVGFVELFFDLVFVFAVTQVSHNLLHHLTWLGALQSALLFGAVWWAWIDTSWITNWLNPDRSLVRIMMFGLMGAGLVMSTSLPDAFGDKGLVFALAFVSLQVGRGLFTLWAVRSDPGNFRNFQRIVTWALLGSVFWIAGGLLDGQQRLMIWIIAVSLEFAGPGLGFFVPGLGRSSTADWTVEGGHLAERVGLFVIICLGETLLITGSTFADAVWSLPVILAFTSAFVATLAMWWLYFSRKHDAASKAISQSSDPGALARRAYTYGPLILIAGIIVSAVGDELVLAHPLGAIPAATAFVLIGGPLLFLIGTAVAIFSVWGRWPLSRLLGAAALVALWPAMPILTPLAMACCATAVLVLIAIWETTRRTEA